MTYNSSRYSQLAETSSAMVEHLFLPNAAIRATQNGALHRAAFGLYPSQPAVHASLKLHMLNNEAVSGYAGLSHISGVSDEGLSLRGRQSSIIDQPLGQIFAGFLGGHHPFSHGRCAIDLDTTDDIVQDHPSAELETLGLWDQFHRLGTEMVITKSGRYVCLFV